MVLKFKQSYYQLNKELSEENSAIIQFNHCSEEGSFLKRFFDDVRNNNQNREF